MPNDLYPDMTNDLPEPEEAAEEFAAPTYQPTDQDVTHFAQTNYRGMGQKFGVRRPDRRRHMYVIGKTGMGKSTLLENMIIQDIQNGEGVAVVDPHGDLVEKVIEYIPSHRINDVVYVNPADLDYPIAFNPLETVDPEFRNIIADGLVGVFKKIWAESWGPRLEYILINTILALLEYPGSSLLGVMRMLVDPGFRKRVLRKVDDPVVKGFWVNEFNNYSEKFRNEAIAPIQNKVGQFLASSLIRNIIGQSKSTVDIRKAMDEGKIMLLNLSKGSVGEESAALLGAMWITKIQLAAMSRVDTPEEERRDFYLYVDEFQNFSTDSFASILSEARKYRLNIIMAHQYIEQLSEEVAAAVFGNVGTMVAFRIGATDGEELEKEFAPTFEQADLVSLPAYHIYLRLMIDGVASEPFSANTLPPLSGKTGNRDKVINASRERYTNKRIDVEETIARWSAVDENELKVVEERLSTKRKEYEEKMAKKQALEDAGKEDVEEVDDGRHPQHSAIPKRPTVTAPPPAPPSSVSEETLDEYLGNDINFLSQLDDSQDNEDTSKEEKETRENTDSSDSSKEQKSSNKSESKNEKKSATETKSKKEGSDDGLSKEERHRKAREEFNNRKKKNKGKRDDKRKDDSKQNGREEGSSSNKKKTDDRKQNDTNGRDSSGHSSGGKKNTEKDSSRSTGKSKERSKQKSRENADDGRRGGSKKKQEEKRQPKNEDRVEQEQRPNRENKDSRAKKNDKNDDDPRGGKQDNDSKESNRDNKSSSNGNRGNDRNKVNDTDSGNNGRNDSQDGGGKKKRRRRRRKKKSSDQQQSQGSNRSSGSASSGGGSNTPENAQQNKSANAGGSSEEGKKIQPGQSIHFD